MALPIGRGDVAAVRRASVFVDLLNEIWAAASVFEKKELAGIGDLKREVEAIFRKNYNQALRRSLSRWEVKEIAREGRTRVWPGLNRHPVTLVSPKEFVRRWSAFGVDFKFASLPWKDGLALLGFYVNRLDHIRSRPLIFVNTAHPPAVVGVALDHEMGHHLTAELFGSRNATHLLSQTGFQEHLTEPAELAADVLVSLGIFPAPIARKLFVRMPPAPAAHRPGGLSDLALAKVLEYVGSRYSFRLMQVRGAKKRFHALAALVHYAKLRRALLDEYDT
jgi:hypothetical protein